MGYSRAVVADPWVFVAGTTGYNYDNMTISSDIVEQTEQCFKNIQSALQRADSSLADVVMNCSSYLAVSVYSILLVLR